MKKITIPLSLITSLVVLNGCGGGSSDPEPTPPPVTPPAPVVTTAQGQFFAGDITGISYVSGDISGTVDENGQYEYEIIDDISQTITFSVAGIELGSAVGKATISPIDLAQNADINSPDVVNRMTLLQLLAEDPTNTITLDMDERLLNNADNFDWPAPDFSSSDFGASVEMVQILGDVNVFLGEQRTVSSDGSQAYLESRIYCHASGIYYGDIEGGDTGHITFGLSPLDGTVTALGWSDTAQNIIFIQAPASPTYGPTIQFDSGASLGGESYVIEITDNEVAAGTWTNETAQTNGTVETTNLDRAQDSAFHFSAAYIAVFPVFGPAPAGIYSFDLMPDGTVSGTQVNITFGDTTTTPISGEWNGNIMSATVEGGATINAFLDFTTMTLLGEWEDMNAPITSGGVTGTGCQINPI